VSREAFKFLICGSLAAAVNWAARIALSLAMPFEAAVIVAYVIGMTVGFILYRGVVWSDRTSSLKEQIVGFIVVNAFSAAIVFASALGLRSFVTLIVGPGAITDAFAHGAAIAIGAVANFIGHRTVTFRARATR
jgi:putative flippase GtrA